MTSEKIEKIMKADLKKQRKDSFYDFEYGVVEAKTVFFTDRKLLVANEYDLKEVKGYNARTNKLITNKSLAETWYDVIIPKIEGAHKVELYIPKLFYEVAKAFVNPALIKKTPRSHVYEVAFLRDKIIITEYKKDDIMLTFAEEYEYIGAIKILPVFNLFYLLLLKPSHVLLFQEEGTNMIMMSVIESHDKDIKDFAYIVLANRIPDDTIEIINKSGKNETE